MAETVSNNPFAILIPAFEAWFEKAVPENKVWDFSPYDLCLMGYMAGHSASCNPPDPAVAELVEALRDLFERSREVRVEGRTLVFFYENGLGPKSVEITARALLAKHASPRDAT